MSLLYCTALQQVAILDDEAFEIIGIDGLSDESLMYLADAPEKTLGLLLERADRGSLRALLNDSPAEVVDVEAVQLRLAAGIASGMEYLHAHNVLHHDLKSANVATTRLEPPPACARVGWYRLLACAV